MIFYLYVILGCASFAYSWYVHTRFFLSDFRAARSKETRVGLFFFYVLGHLLLLFAFFRPLRIFDALGPAETAERIPHPIRNELRPGSNTLGGRKRSNTI